MRLQEPPSRRIKIKTPYIQSFLTYFLSYKHEDNSH